LYSKFSLVKKGHFLRIQINVISYLGENGGRFYALEVDCKQAAML